VHGRAQAPQPLSVALDKKSPPGAFWGLRVTPDLPRYAVTAANGAGWPAAQRVTGQRDGRRVKVKTQGCNVVRRSLTVLRMKGYAGGLVRIDGPDVLHIGLLGRLPDDGGVSFTVCRSSFSCRERCTADDDVWSRPDGSG